MAESKKVGYYTQDTGRNVYHFFMGAEPPEKQFMLHGATWQLVSDRAASRCRCWSSARSRT